MNQKWKPMLTLILCGGISSCTTPSKKPEADRPLAEQPKLLKPSVKKIWIPPEIRNGGTEWVEGHYIFRIEKETTWSR